jgi:cell division protein FtsL
MFMNRTTFLFLALLIVSCIMTVNSRHEARTLITDKAVLSEKVTSLKETIRRLELGKARVVARAAGVCEDDEEEPATNTPVKAEKAGAATPS